MNLFFPRRALNIFLTAIVLVLPVKTFASNGLYLIGYGNESVLMGGADVAVARDAFAANNNPAGMTQMKGQAMDLELAAFYHFQTTHTDSFGNYRKPITNGYGAFGNGAYARRFDNSPFAAGVALVVQGGTGYTYSGINTAFGTRDDASSLFTIIKLAPAFAWEVNDQLSLGLNVGINYLGVTQELFPNTSAGPFSGIRFKGASGIGLNTRLGLQYRPVKDVTIGITYAPQSSIPVKNGTLRVNLTNAGLGVVRYDNAKLTGLRLPEELALGVAFRPTPSLLISLQDKWYNWSEAINTLQLSASNPRNPLAPPSLPIPPSAINLVDQHVIEMGFAYDYDQDTVIMGGINHGSRPLPDQNTSPIFALIQARHYTLGFTRTIDKKWKGSYGVEWYPLQSVTYDNANSVFGPRANERHYAAVFHLSAIRRW